MNEAVVSKNLRQALVSLGAVCWKVSDRFHASRPDLMIAHRGKCAFLEMKIWPAIPTPLQAHTLSELQAVGIQMFVGQYDKQLKKFSVNRWGTIERHYFDHVKEVSQWLLEQIC